MDHEDQDIDSQHGQRWSVVCFWRTEIVGEYYGKLYSSSHLDFKLDINKPAC